MDQARHGTGVSMVKASVLALSLGFAMLGAQAQPQAGSQTVVQQSIPDAPRPQTTLPGAGKVTPGLGSASSSGDDASVGASTGATGSAPAPSTQAAGAQATADPAEQSQPAVTTSDYKTFTLNVGVNFVQVPFTVKDSKNSLIHGLEARDIRVYENGNYQPIVRFNRGDRSALAVALVIDQSMSTDDMTRVNNSLGALQAAFAPFDMVAVFDYNNGPKEVTTFTAAQSARLTQAIEMSKAPGREPLLAGSLDGPLSQTTIVNNQNFDPNTAANRGHSSMQINAPRDLHTLNDAIFEAAKALTKMDGRTYRRVIYVISNGNEYGSQVKPKDVIHYLQTNNISVFGTIVGETALWGIGTLDHLHLPGMMEDNILPQYAKATGGNFDSEFRTGQIEKSFARIVEEAGNQYVLGYYTHLNPLDNKYRTIEVKVVGHGNDLTIMTERGYYPSAVDATRPMAPPATAP
jgi:VWFA-related protein